MKDDEMKDKSTFQVRGEGLEGGSNDKMVHDSQNEQKAYGEAGNGLKSQNEKSETLMAPAKRGNNGKGWMVACIVAVALLLVGGGVTVWMMLRKQDNSGVVAGDDVESGDSESSGEGSESAEPTGEEIEAKHVANVSDFVGKMEAVLKEYLMDDGKELVVFERDDTMTPLYQSSDMKVATRLSRGIGFIGNSIEETNYGGPLFDMLWGELGKDAYRGLIETTFAENGFVKVGEDWIPSGEYVNWETGVICSDVGSGLPIYFTCGYIGWLDEDKVILADELAEAYEEKTGYDLGFVDVNPKDIEDSEVKPYQRLGANLYGAAGLFYRVSPESKWQFFMATQAAVGCSAYNTEDLKKAYAGEVCYSDDGKEDIVKP